METKTHKRILDAFRDDLPNVFKSNLKRLKHNEYPPEFVNKCFQQSLLYKNFYFMDLVLDFYPLFKPNIYLNDFHLFINIISSCEYLNFVSLIKKMEINESQNNDFIIYLYERELLNKRFITFINDSVLSEHININFKKIFSEKPFDLNNINNNISLLSKIKNF